MNDTNRANIGVGGLALRVVLYGALLALLATSFRAETVPAGLTDLYTEYGLAEWIQSGLLATMAILFFLVTRRHAGQRPLAVVMTGAAVTALVRESDWLLDKVFDGLWQLLVTVTLAVTVAAAWRYRRGFRAAVEGFTGSLAGGLIVAGSLIVFVFSRMYGTDALWEFAMGDNYVRSAKNLAQEGIESLGYLLMTLGAAEYALSCLSPAARRHPGDRS